MAILWFSNWTKAEKVGIGEVLFEENNSTSQIEPWFFINELSYILIKWHLSIASKEGNPFSYQGEELESIKKLEELSKANVIEILDLAKNKQETLNIYLSTVYQELQKWGGVSAGVKGEMGLFKAEMESCLIEKGISDKAYFDAIERYDQAIMETALKESIQHENCVSTNRIQYNAKASIANKLVFYLWLLQKKYDVIFAKQEILASNFTVFRDNILPDLNEIDQLLQQYKF